MLVRVPGTVLVVAEDRGGEGSARSGFPEFEHNQWTVEGEIERLGAFAAGTRRAGGWKRVVATLLVLGLIVPMIAGTLFVVVRAITGTDDVPTQFETPFDQSDPTVVILTPSSVAD